MTFLTKLRSAKDFFVSSVFSRWLFGLAFWGSIMLTTVTGCGSDDPRRSVAERWARSQHDQLGFRLVEGRPVFRTNNPEPLAPDWNEPVNADAGSFKALFAPPKNSVGFQYACDAHKVFIGVGKRVYELEAADPATIKILDSFGYFAVDGTHVYYAGFKLEDVDAGSFEVVGTHYGKDRASVFFGPMRLVGANPPSFVVLSERDTSLVNLDFSGAGPFRKLAFHEKRQEVTFSGCWSKDNTTCFHGPNQIKPADAATFRVLDPKTAEDRSWRYREEGVNALKIFERSRSSP